MINKTRVVRKGGLFVFEGPDNSGKTTLAHAFADYLNSIGMKCEYFAFPGQEIGTLGKHVLDLHFKSAVFGIQSINPTSLQLLHIAAHIDWIESRILPSLRKGDSVVLDRFWWSTWVYGVVSGVNPKSLRVMIQLESLHWKGISPEIVFLVRREKPLGKSTSLRWDQLVDEYTKLAARENRKYQIRFIDNEGTIAEALSEIIQHVKLNTRSATHKKL